MKHYETRAETVCEIYGHGKARWLPLEGPPPFSQDEADRPKALVCLFCTKIIKRST